MNIFKRLKLGIFESNPGVRDEMLLAQERANAERRAARIQAQQQPAVAIFEPVDRIDVDLYNVYVLRLLDDGLGTVPLDILRSASTRYRGIPTPSWFKYNTLMTIEKPLIFSCFITILLACDKAHDFTYSNIKDNLTVYKPPSGITFELDDNAKAIFDYIVNANVEQVTTSISAAFDVAPGRQRTVLNNSKTLLGYCMCLINFELSRSPLACGTQHNTSTLEGDYGMKILKTILSSDRNAKNAVIAITRILGIYVVDHTTVMRQPSSAEVVRQLAPAPRFFNSRRKTVQVRIDATSAAINNNADIQALVGGGSNEAVVVDSASANDPANIGHLEKTFGYFGRRSVQLDLKNINAYVTVGRNRVNVLNAVLGPAGIPAGQDHIMVAPGAQIPPINITVNEFLSRSTATHQIVPNDNSITAVMNKIFFTWFGFQGKTGVVLTPAEKLIFDEAIKNYTMEKTLGDFIQIITYAATHQPKVFITFDIIAGCIAGILGSTTILDAGTARRFVFRRLFITSGYFINKNVGLLDWCANAFEEITRPEAGFGKINNVSKRLKFMSHLELKNKLKSVGIKITKNVRGKRKYLSRKELENKALLFNKLQNTAKRIKIKIMYKSRNGMYKYKTYKRLQKEINSKKINSKYNINRKYKKPVVRNFNFG
jgi:hypothetical protein